MTPLSTAPLKAKTPDLSPEVWHLEDGTPIYMYSIEAFYHFRDRAMQRFYHESRPKGSVFMQQHSSGSHKKHSHIPS